MHISDLFLYKCKEKIKSGRDLTHSHHNYLSLLLFAAFVVLVETEHIADILVLPYNS